jgi:hypothetical protein
VKHTLVRLVTLQSPCQLPCAESLGVMLDVSPFPRSQRRKLSHIAMSRIFPSAWPADGCGTYSTASSKSIFTLPTVFPVQAEEACVGCMSSSSTFSSLENRAWFRCCLRQASYHCPFYGTPPAMCAVFN